MSKKPELTVAGSTTTTPADKPVQVVSDAEFDSAKNLSGVHSEDKQMTAPPKTLSAAEKRAYFQGGSDIEQSAPPPLPVTRLSDIDRLSLEVAKANRRAALAQAKQAMAENEASEGAYKYFVLQLYMKYGLTERDAIGENGEIMRGQGDIIRQQQVPNGNVR